MVRESCVMGPSADLSERLEVTALMSFALGALYHFYELFLLPFFVEYINSSRLHIRDW